jgi:hypothetical protein
MAPVPANGWIPAHNNLRPMFSTRRRYSYILHSNVLPVTVLTLFMTSATNMETVNKK